MSESQGPRDPTRHLDLDGLADHLAGEVDAGGHLRDCGGCSARLAELTAAEHLVVAALRSLPEPVLPAAVADRLSARLAAAPVPGQDSAPVRSVRSLPPVPLVPLVPLVRCRRRWVPSVAAGLVLAAGGLLGYGLLVSSDRGPESAAGLSAQDSQDSRDSQDSQDNQDNQAAPAAPTTRTVASGLDYADAGAVGRALPRVLDGTVPRTTGSAPGREARTDPLARLRQPAALADCLAAALDPARDPALDPAPTGRRPLALDYASYAGAPALAVVLPVTDPEQVAVLVVGPDCSRADADRRAATRLARP